MASRIQFSVQLKRSAAVAILMAGMALGALLLSAVQSQSEHSGDGAEVRVNVRSLEDGRVEIGLQQRGDDGAWGERHLPSHRFLPADAPPEWRNSSPIMLEPSAAMSEDMSMMGEMGEMDEMGEAASGAGPPPGFRPEFRPLTAAEAQICWISHGAELDPFWLTARGVGELISVNSLGLTGVTLESAATTPEQAAAIRRCVDDGKHVIATTLADPEGLAEAVNYAHEAGVLVTSFNAGTEAASELGSIIHLSIDNRQSGVDLGERFADAELSGDVLCVLHEARNVSLVERCDGIQEGYGDGGEVVQFDASATGVSDVAGTAAAIGGELAANSYAAVVLLNQGLAYVVGPMIAELEAGGADPIVTASYGGDVTLFELLRQDTLDYFVFDQAPLQGYMAATNAFYAAWVSGLLDPRGSPTIQIEISSVIYDQSTRLDVIDTTQPPEAGG